MGANERRIAIWHTLCSCRQVNVNNLAVTYHVCPRTIRYDLEHLSLSHPIVTVRGRYGGCVKLPDWYKPGTSPITTVQMDFLVRIFQSMRGTDALIMSSIIHALAPE